MRDHNFKPISLFDKFLSNYRYSRVFKTLNLRTDIKQTVDMGCGSGHLVQLLKTKGYDSIGIDINPGTNIIAADLNKPLPLEAGSVDLVTSLANIEHLHHPEINLAEIHRVLKKGGTCILTTPSTAAKPVLEFLAFKLKLIDRREIEDHKMYFTKKLLLKYFEQAGFSDVNVKYFQMGLNLHAVAVK